MKKLYYKNKKIKTFIKNTCEDYFLLKSIIKNTLLFVLLRYNAYLKLKFINLFHSSSNKCSDSYNKKRFNKFSFYSRSIFSKKVQNGEIFGFIKTSW